MKLLFDVCILPHGFLVHPLQYVGIASQNRATVRLDHLVSRSWMRPTRPDALLHAPRDCGPAAGLKLGGFLTTMARLPGNRVVRGK